MLQIIKKSLFGSKGRMRIKFGIAKGLQMVLDPQHDTQVLLGLAEAEIAQDFRKLAIQADIFLDVGAAYGYYSLVFAKWNPKGKIYLFDASPAFLPIQKENFKLNNFSNEISPVSKFVSNQNSDSTIAVDAVLEKMSIGLKALIKIDVEGAELDVLKGCEKSMENHFLSFVIETHTLDLERECVAFLQKRGYSATIKKPAFWRTFIPEKRIVAHNQWIIATKK